MNLKRIVNGQELLLYDRSSVEVYDVTADAETRSVLVLSDETMIISSVSANALNKRIHEDYDK